MKEGRNGRALIFCHQKADRGKAAGTEFIQGGSSGANRQVTGKHQRGHVFHSLQESEAGTGFLQCVKRIQVRVEDAGQSLNPDPLLLQCRIRKEGRRDFQEEMFFVSSSAAEKKISDLISNLRFPVLKLRAQRSISPSCQHLFGIGIETFIRIQIIIDHQMDRQVIGLQIIDIAYFDRRRKQSVQFFKIRAGNKIGIHQQKIRLLQEGDKGDQLLLRLVVIALQQEIGIGLLFQGMKNICAFLIRE